MSRHGGLTADPSASKIDGFIACPASHVFPQAPERTVQADRGNAGHKPLSDSINGTGPRSKLADALTDGIENLTAEPAFVVNVKKRTSRLVGIDIGRQYGRLEPYDVPVSLDVMGKKNELTAWIRDWKFGTYSSMWQLYIQAMAVLFRSNSKEIIVDAGFVYLGADEPKPREELYTIGRMELEDRADEVVEAFDKVKDLAKLIKDGGTPNLSQGPWCKYCPSRAVCPAKWALLRGAMGNLKGPLAGIVGEVTREQCGEAWEQLTEILRLAEAAKAQLTERLIEGDKFPLSNGKTLMIQRRKGWSYPKKDPTIALLEELGATQEQIDSVMVTRADSFVPIERKEQ